MFNQYIILVFGHCFIVATAQLWIQAHISQVSVIDIPEDSNSPVNGPLRNNLNVAKLSKLYLFSIYKLLYLYSMPYITQVIYTTNFAERYGNVYLTFS